MKRFLVGAGWCMVIWMGTVILGGIVIGAVAGFTIADPAAAAQAGEQAGAEFGSRWGNIILLAAIAISTVGTMGGWLPGTRPEEPPALGTPG
jgi:hypothetical protein